MTTSDLRPDSPGEGVSRRVLLTRSASAGAGIVLTGSIPGLFGTAQAKNGGEVGYGPLIPDADGILSLPEGFSYKLVASSGETLLETGEPTPDDPDGTAAFVRRGGNGSVLVNNHEIGGGESFRVPPLEGFTYDPKAGGGTTNIEVDKDGNRVREVVSLAGTHNNCAGGRTPWETWITCEETESSPAGSTLRHGYCFEVSPYDQDANRDPKPIRALGRFAHESVAVDPHTHVIYETEDASNPNGLLYRWTPPAAALPLGAGSLKALADDAGELHALRALTKRGEFVPDLSVFTEPGTRLKLQWVPVPDRAATTVSTRKQAYAAPVTRSRKLEGMWWGDGGAYFVASFARTGDGSAAEHDGQVWFIDPDEDRMELKIWFAYTPADQDNDPDGPDNITVSPFGGVIVAEDGEGRQHLVGATDDGETYFFARNELADDSEFTGPTFSMDKKILFANIQSPGHVFAITGPFRKQ
ncbi:MAG TPA: alkaline phosphatase PhoX [Solirubrobacteraceae bacterium]|nr:alkaline phosphatase PhoX [Solirubrobacteraceae bacterium]